MHNNELQDKGMLAADQLKDLVRVRRPALQQPAAERELQHGRDALVDRLLHPRGESYLEVDSRTADNLRDQLIQSNTSFSQVKAILQDNTLCTRIGCTGRSDVGDVTLLVKGDAEWIAPFMTAKTRNAAKSLLFPHYTEKYVPNPFNPLFD
jgi:hypothetical protein